LTRFFSGCDQQTAAEVAQMKGQMVAVDQAANIGIQFQGERRQYEFSPDIKRTGKDPIPRSAFQNELFAGISGLIWSRRAIGNFLGPPDDFIFVHNQAAERPIRRKWIKWVEEYLPVEDGKQLCRLKHRT
jgi:hypothetical protein